MAVDLSENPPKFETSIEGLVARPNASLRHEKFLRVSVVVGTFYFFRVPHIAIVGLHPLAGLEAVGKLIQKNLDVVPLTSGVRSSDPHPIPCEDVHPELVA